MNIIVVGPDYSLYSAASYQYEFMNSLKEISAKYFHYTEKYKIDLDDLFNKAQFMPDIIFYNHGWFNDNPKLENITYGEINKNSNYSAIKHVIFLNKEYTRLKEKLKAIKNYNFNLIFSHLHDFDKINSTSISSIFLPLACSYENISKYKDRKLDERKYDLFFSGILQNWNHKNMQSDLRKKYNLSFFTALMIFLF